MKSDRNHIGAAVRVLRPRPRVFTDEIGKNIWMGEVEHIELELGNAPSSDPYNRSGGGDDVWSRLRAG
jgi:hypothetical protein